MPKPHRKLLAYNKIYMEMNKKYGFRDANKWLEADWTRALYLHDADTASFIPYCYAYDLKRLAEEGLFFLDNFNYQPPKHLGTFVDFVKEFVSYVTNRTSGACGLPNLLPYMYYFWDRDVAQGYYTVTPMDYAKQQIQRFLYAVNQPMVRNGIQSAFTNTNIFDHEYLMALFGGAVFPDGKFMVDELDGIMRFQKLFLEEMSRTRAENMFTYPVNSISLLRKNGKFVDEDFAKWACKHNMKWGDSNFFVDDSVTSLSNCPLSGDTEIIIKEDDEWKRTTIQECFSEGPLPKIITTLNNGQKISCKVNKFNIPVEYEVTLVNGATFKTTSNHLNYVYGKGSIPTEDLTTEDYLPYGRHGFEESDHLAYEDGKVIGMFLGDGSYNSNNAIIFSLNRDSKADLIDFLYDEIAPKYGATTVSEYDCVSSISGKNSCVNVYVGSKALRGLIEEYVIGDSALTKELNMKALGNSEAFRRGILDGWKATDGGNNQRIYTSSLPLVKSMQSLLMSLGMVSTVTEDNREGRLGKNTCYTFRYYQPNSKKMKQKDVYIKDNDYQWMKIKKIERISGENCSYCLEVVDNSKPAFTLANGIITHNCRLKSNIDDLGFFSSIGGTALRVGSVKVSTINLARLALEHDNEKDFLVALREITEINLKVLDTVRHIIQRNIEKGFLPNYCDGLIDIKTQYMTIGVLGVYEVMKTFGYTTVDEFGNVIYKDEAFAFGKKIFDVINREKDQFALDKDYMLNIEAVPGETAAARMQKADEMLYPDKVVKDLPLYGNQFIPLGIKTTLNERLKVAAAFDSYCNGGSILHVNIDSPFSSFDQAWKALNYISDSGITYFAFNTKISACEHNHGFYGNICPTCGGEKITEYTRIVGFFVPERTYSKERKQEVALRQWDTQENIKEQIN